MDFAPLCRLSIKQPHLGCLHPHFKEPSGCGAYFSSCIFFFFLTWMKTLIHERDRVRRGIARRVLKPCANLHRPVRDCLYWRQPKLFEWVWLPPRATCPSNACGVHFQADAVKCSQPCVWVFKVGSVENAE